MDKDLTTTGILDVEEFVKDVATNLNVAMMKSEGASKLVQSMHCGPITALSNNLSSKILLLMNTILEKNGLKLQTEGGNAEEMCYSMGIISDELAGKINENMNEAKGLKKESEPSMVLITKNLDVSLNKSQNSFSLFTSRKLMKPQNNFKILPDNSYSPFKPAIVDKPNALLSLEESLKLDPPRNGTGEIFGCPHPYQYELDHFEPSPEFLRKAEPEAPAGLDKTKLTYVDTEEELDNVISKLKVVKEIAVDLEHHSYRSYLGFTCLMQLSTREEDFIIDTLTLRHFMYRINGVFTDPNIVKVLHGSDSDVVWLQKDFGVYLVNTFDTGQASRTLGFPHFSYAYVLDHYCKVKADKQYQLADWRIRPLPKEHIRYAREDTHYLLYIYDRMKNDLLDQNSGFPALLTNVIKSSTNICKKRFEKPQMTENSYREVYSNLCSKNSSKSFFNGKQMEVMKRLYHWRDHTARIDDESTGFILSNKEMLQMAETMPRDKARVMACLGKAKTGGESIFEIISSVLDLPDSYFDFRDIEPLSSAPNASSSKPSPLDHPKFYNLESGVRNGFYCEVTDTDTENDYDESLFANLVKTSTTGETSCGFIKLIEEAERLGKIQRQKQSNVVAEVLSTMSNPFLPYWPDSILQAALIVDNSTEVWRLKQHTVLTEERETLCPEVIPAKSILTFEENEKIDDLIKTVRTQIHEETEKKRKVGDEPDVEDSQIEKKIKRLKVTANDMERSDFKPHQYETEDIKKIFKGEPESSRNKDDKRSRDNKRKADDFNSDLHAKKKPFLHQSFVSNKSSSFMPRTPKNAHSSSGASKTPSISSRIPWPGTK